MNYTEHETGTEHDEQSLHAYTSKLIEDTERGQSLALTRYLHENHRTAGEFH